MISSSRSFFFVAGALVLAAACGSDDKGQWTLSDATTNVTSDNHVVVDVTFVNDGKADWQGSRCVVIDWEKGGVQSRDDVRAQKAPTTPIDIIETERFCNGGNTSLPEGAHDLFHVTSTHLRDDLAGSTIVVAAEDSKGTVNDDRVTIASP